MSEDHLLSHKIKSFVSSYKQLDPKQAKILEHSLRSACLSFQESTSPKYNLNFKSAAGQKVISGSKRFLAGVSQLKNEGLDIELINNAQILLEKIVAYAEAPKKRGNKRNDIIPKFIYCLASGYRLAFNKLPKVVKNPNSSDKKSHFHTFFERSVEIIMGKHTDIKTSTLQDYITGWEDFTSTARHEKIAVDNSEFDDYIENLTLPAIEEKLPELKK